MASRGYMSGQSRRIRSPSSPFHVRQEPFDIQPFAIMPVLAGETLKNLTFQIRAVTDPIKSPLIGWWYETYWFYIKMTDMVGAQQIDTIWDPTEVFSGVNLVSADNLRMYTKHTAANGQAKFIQLAYERIVQHWFRDDNAAAVSAGAGVLRAQRVNKDTWNSMKLRSEVTTEEPVLTVGVDDTFTASELEQLQRDWNLQRMAGLTQMSYIDYLASQGVNLPEDEDSIIDRPELLRYQREWQYPSNTVEPTTGVPSSAVSWAISGRADKDRFFKEPGFIMGVSVVRPKIYLKAQHGSLVGFMNSAERWMPRQMMDQLETGWFDLASTDNVADNAATVVVDLRDLLEYGEQFVSESPDGAYYFNQMDMDDAQMLGRFPLAADIVALFSAPASKYIRSDGVADWKIATSLPRDMLQGSDARA